MKNKVKRSRISYWDIEELAAYMTGLGDEYDDEKLEEEFYDKFDCDLDTFQKLIEHLLPLVVVGKTIGGGVHRGFGAEGVFFLKEEVPVQDQVQ